MNKILFSIIVVAILALTNSCKKTLDPSSEDGISFLVRLPSIAQARFEARCVSEDIFLDQVKIQSPSALYVSEEFNHQRIAKNEFFFFGNNDAEDGLWLITFVGTSAITNKEFNIIVPYEMLIAVDDTDE